MGAESPCVHHVPIAHEGREPERPRQWQNLSIRQRLRSLFPRNWFAQMTNQPLPYFRIESLPTHGQGIQGDAKVDEGQNSGRCCLWPFAFPVVFSRLAYNPSADASGFLAGLTSTLPVSRVRELCKVWSYCAGSRGTVLGLECSVGSGVLCQV